MTRRPTPPFLGPLLGTRICSSLKLRYGTSLPRCPIIEVPPPLSSHHPPRIAFKQRRGKAGGPMSTHFPIQVGLLLILLTTWERRPSHHLSLSLPVTENSSTIYSVPAVSAPLACASFHPEATQTDLSGQCFCLLASTRAHGHVPFSGVVFFKQKPDDIQGLLRHLSKIQALCQQAPTPSHLCPLLTPPCHHAGSSGSLLVVSKLQHQADSKKKRPD